MNSDNMILVVDDEPLALSGTSRLLKQSGYKVIEAQTGEQALQSARKYMPDLILLDMVLPDMDGLEICRILITDNNTSGILICIISGIKTTSSDQFEGLEDGADDYIVRPIENRELLARVQAMIRLRNTEKELEKHRSHLEALAEERTAKLQREISERITAENALCESEEKLRLFVEYAPAALAMFDREMRYVAVSRRWMTDYQLVDQDIIGRPHYDVFPEIPDRWKTAHRRGLAGEIVQTQEDKFIRLDGTIQFLRWELRPWHKADGSIGGIVIFTEDATDRKRAEEALRDSEKKYREVVENANEAIAIIQDGRIQFINRKATEISGYSEEELMSRPFIEFVHPDEKQMVMHHHLKRLKGEEIPEVYEIRILAKDGDVKWIENNGVIVSWEGKPATLNLLTEITKRKQAETLLAIAKKQWEATFDAISDWVSIIDKNHNIIRSNNASKSLVDLSPKNVVGKHCHEIVHGRDCPIPDCPMELAVNSKQREYMEIQLENGRWVQISVDPIDGENKDEFFVHIVRDITDRKRVEVEKDKLEAQKRHIQKAESLTRMAGAIAHNFNNQLQVVIGNLGMAMNDQPRDSEFLVEALKAAHKATEVSALMLTYSGKQPGNHEPIDLSAACRQSLTLLQAAAPKGTMLKADLPASGQVIRCNAGQIQQVIINLVTNAWESADESRRGIGLTAKTVSQKDIPAFKRFPAGWNPQESAYACLEVVDAGCGIACKDIEKIFDPFFTTKFTGRGLGLSAVLGIVTAHNGGITLESQPGHGSVFRVFFPLSKEEILRQPDKPLQPLEIQGGGTVLLIEDEEQVRKMASTMLTRLGYTVLEAKDGIEAVEIFQQHKNEIRCVLSDLTMPRMNGWATLAALRQISPDIPVILSSGYDEAQVMEGEHPVLPNAFLGKPYRLQDLKDTIRRILADKKKASPGYEPL